MKKKIRDSWLKVFLALLLLMPIVGWILSGDFFDYSETVLCPSRLFFDIECFGCGITRAVMHMHNFQYSEALYYNYLVIGVYPAMVFVWGRWTWGLLKKLKLVDRWLARAR